MIARSSSIAGAAALLLLAACGSSGGAARSAAQTPRPASAASGQPGATTLCALISAAEISRVMGGSFMQPEATGGDPSATGSGVCTSSAADGSVNVNVAYVANGAPALGSPAPGDRSLGGLGDRAWCSDWAPGGKDVRVQRGAAGLVVVSDTCAHSEAIARIVLGRL